MMVEKYKTNRSEGNKKRYIKYPWLKKQISNKLKGRKKSEETKKRMRESWKEGREMVGGMKGMKHSKESKEQMSRAKKGKHLSPKTEFEKGMIPWNKGKDCLQLSGENHPNWKGGKSFEPYSIDWTETLRRSIRERDRYICQLCSGYGDNVHHIDYDKKNCNPDNLINLCRGCNSKVNFNRDYWTEYFIKVI